jgi:hypothetical protein
VNDREREAFEAWAIGDDPKVNTQLGRDEDGEYIVNVIAACWDAWQASAAYTRGVKEGANG